MTKEEAEIYADHMTYRAAIANALSAKCVPYRRATLTKLNRLLSVLESSGIEEDDFQTRMAIKALEQEPRKGHWINKHRLFDSCSAECSSCHKRSNGYMHDNGFGLVSTYYDFCPKCGSDNREVEG